MNGFSRIRLFNDGGNCVSVGVGGVLVGFSVGVDVEIGVGDDGAGIVGKGVGGDVGVGHGVAVGVEPGGVGIGSGLHPARRSITSNNKSKMYTRLCL